MIRVSFIGIFIITFTLISASKDQCRGKCPIGNPNNDVFLLPHEDCDKFCSCVYGTPHEMICPPGTHFSNKYHVCTDPFIANCTKLNIESIRSVEDERIDNECIGRCPNLHQANSDIVILLAHKNYHKFCKCEGHSVLIQQCEKDQYFNLKFGGCINPLVTKYQNIMTYLPENLSNGCIGTCPTWEVDDLVHLPHKNCSKYCKCNFENSIVMECPSQLHFNPNLSVCDHPSQAGCVNNNFINLNDPFPVDFSRCIGSCPKLEGDNVVHLPHENCTKFCKCDFGYPFVMSCPPKLFFNPILKVCDQPSHSHCTGFHEISN